MFKKLLSLFLFIIAGVISGASAGDVAMGASEPVKSNTNTDINLKRLGLYRVLKKAEAIADSDLQKAQDEQDFDLIDEKNEELVCIQRAMDLLEVVITKLNSGNFGYARKGLLFIGNKLNFGKVVNHGRTRSGKEVQKVVEHDIAPRDLRAYSNQFKYFRKYLRKYSLNHRSVLLPADVEFCKEVEALVYVLERDILSGEFSSLNRVFRMDIWDNLLDWGFYRPIEVFKEYPMVTTAIIVLIVTVIVILTAKNNIPSEEPERHGYRVHENPSYEASDLIPIPDGMAEMVTVNGQSDSQCGPNALFNAMCFVDGKEGEFFTDKEHIRKRDEAFAEWRALLNKKVDDELSALRGLLEKDKALYDAEKTPGFLNWLKGCFDYSPTATQLSCSQQKLRAKISNREKRINELERSRKDPLKDVDSEYIGKLLETMSEYSSRIMLVGDVEELAAIAKNSSDSIFLQEFCDGTIHAIGGCILNVIRHYDDFKRLLEVGSAKLSDEISKLQDCGDDMRHITGNKIPSGVDPEIWRDHFVPICKKIIDDVIKMPDILQEDEVLYDAIMQKFVTYLTNNEPQIISAYERVKEDEHSPSPYSICKGSISNLLRDKKGNVCLVVHVPGHWIAYKVSYSAEHGISEDEPPIKISIADSMNFDYSWYDTPTKLIYKIVKDVWKSMPKERKTPA